MNNIGKGPAGTKTFTLRTGSFVEDFKIIIKLRLT